MKRRLALFTGCLIASGTLGHAAEDFRTDINPALLYYQAFLQAPELSREDYHYLFETDWRGRPLEPRMGELLARYDVTFRVLREAGQSQVACDWGLDLSRGPEALLPGLARAKTMVHVARLRTAWDLARRNENEARQDLAGVFRLAHNVSRDGVLVSALVQIAMEQLIVTTVAEHFYEFSPETLQRLAADFAASPPRGTIVACLPVERDAFRDWLIRKIEIFQKENPDDAKVVEETRAMIRRNFATGGDQADLADKLVKAAGGTSAGVLKFVRDLDAWYDRMGGLLALPYEKFEPAIKAFSEDMRNSPNPLVPLFFSAFGKCREKEFAAEAGLAMLRAAVAYKAHGREAFQAVRDPFGTGPFGFQRFRFKDVERGFELTSAFHGRGPQERLIFVETNGPAFQVSGKNAGAALPGVAEPN